MPNVSFVTYQEAKAIEVANPKPYAGNDWARYYFGDKGSTESGPQAFLMNLGPDIESNAHHREVDQFHVFLGGRNATYCGEPIGPLLVNYADAGVEYGPFHSGEELLQGFVLRSGGSAAKEFAGEEEGQARDRRRRSHRFNLERWLGQPLLPDNQLTTDALIPPSIEGLGIWTLAAGPGATITSPGVRASGGGYWLVVSGQLREGERLLPPMSLGWHPAGASLSRVVAGVNGARLLILQFAADA